MKPKAKVVDIFRPLRGYRPTVSHASIFRRSNSSIGSSSNNHKQQQEQQPQPQPQEQQPQPHPIMELQECVVINSSETSESYIVSSLDHAATNGQWPHNPHLNNLTTTLSSHSATSVGSNDEEKMKEKQQEKLKQQRRLDRSNPLLTLGASSTTSGGDNNNNNNNCHKQSLESSSSFLLEEEYKKINKEVVPTPPSYYKIELVPRTNTVGNYNNKICSIDECSSQEETTTVIVLKSGDDASVQLTPNHNNLLRLATTTNDADNDDEDDDNDHHGRMLLRSRGIILATPIVEEDGIEHEANYQKHHKYLTQRPNQQEETPPQRWTISNNCEIIAIPPSPSSVSMTHVFKKPKGGRTNDNKSALTDRLLPPPMLVKANSSSSSSSSNSSNCSSPYIKSKNAMETDLHILQQSKQFSSLLTGNGNEGDTGNNGDGDLMLSKSLATISLESPPRMTRSIISESLFQESVSSCEEESGVGGGGGKRMSHPSGASSVCAASGGQTMNGGHKVGGGGDGGGGRGGCGLRFDFLSRILDVFSLNGGCCHHTVGSEGGLGNDGDNHMTAVGNTRERMCA